MCPQGTGISNSLIFPSKCNITIFSQTLVFGYLKKYQQTHLRKKLTLRTKSSNLKRDLSLSSMNSHLVVFSRCMPMKKCNFSKIFYRNFQPNNVDINRTFQSSRHRRIKLLSNSSRIPNIFKPGDSTLKKYTKTKRTPENYTSYTKRVLESFRNIWTFNCKSPKYIMI